MSTSESLGLDFRVTTSPGAIYPSITGPNFHHVVMRSFIQHGIGAIDSVDQGAGIDLFMRDDAIAIVQKMTTVQGHELRHPIGAAPARCCGDGEATDLLRWRSRIGSLCEVILKSRSNSALKRNSPRADYRHLRKAIFTRRNLRRSAAARPPPSGSIPSRLAAPWVRRRTRTIRIITLPGTRTQHRHQLITRQHPTIPRGAAGTRNGAATTPAKSRRPSFVWQTRIASFWLIDGWHRIPGRGFR